MNFRKDFPFFKQRRDVIYLDSAATTQKPQEVLDAMEEYYVRKNSNIHRGPNFLAEEATVAYEKARQTVADFIFAAHPHEVIFTRNATEAINLVARSLDEIFEPGDEILLSRLEHHSNIVPWLQLKERRRLVVRYFDINDQGDLVFDRSLITPKTRLIALTGMSNALGVIPDLSPVIDYAHQRKIPVLVDASQLIAHQPINLQSLDADFLVFSGHKIYGPAGIGVLYAKEEFLKAMPPFLGGGDMIQEVFEDRFTPADLPNKFEAGTPNIAGAIGLAAALEWFKRAGHDTLIETERKLTTHALKRLGQLDFVRLVGPTALSGRGPVISFTVQGVHPHDVAEGLSRQRICIRAGHHCAQVLMNRLGLPATARFSFGLYNTTKEIDKAAQALEQVYQYFH